MRPSQVRDTQSYSKLIQYLFCLLSSELISHVVFQTSKGLKNGERIWCNAFIFKESSFDRLGAFLMHLLLWHWQFAERMPNAFGLRDWKAVSLQSTEIVLQLSMSWRNNVDSLPFSSHLLFIAFVRAFVMCRAGAQVEEGCCVADFQRKNLPVAFLCLKIATISGIAFFCRSIKRQLWPSRRLQISMIWGILRLFSSFHSPHLWRGKQPKELWAEESLASTFHCGLVILWYNCQWNPLDNLNV